MSSNFLVGKSIGGKTILLPATIYNILNVSGNFRGTNFRLMRL